MISSEKKAEIPLLFLDEKGLIRDGKSVDSAGVINTTNTFVEED
jgi:hypothetical protein